MHDGDLTGASRADLLRAVRRVDWRYLVGNGVLGRVVYVGRVDHEHLAALRAVADEVVAGDLADPEPAELVVVACPTADELSRAAALVRPGGWIFVEGRPRRSRIGVRQYIALLKEHGFGPPEAFWHFPDFASCLEIIPLHDRAAVMMSLDRRRRSGAAIAKGMLARALLALGLLPRALPAVSVVAQRAGDDKGLSWLTRRQTGSLAGVDVRELSFVLVTPQHETSNNVLFIVREARSPTPRLVVKVPRLRDATSALAHEAAILELLEERLDTSRTSVPHLLGYDDGEAPSVLVESALNGRHLDPHVIRRATKRYVDAVVAWLEAQPVTGRSDLASFERLIETPIQGFGSALQGVPDETWLAQRTLELLEPLRDADIPLVLEHGDLAHPNLIWSSEGQIGVIDWELADERGLPLQDLVFFLMYVASSSRDAAEHPERWARAFDGAFIDSGAWARPFVVREGARLGLDSSLLTPLFVACWARYTTRVVARVEGDPMIRPDAASAAARPPAAPSVQAFVRADRFHALWKFAVDRADGIDWSR